jgi:ketosteroid isomerase-like protein
MRGKARSWPLAAVVLCVVGGIIGGVLGGLAITLYQRDGSHAATTQTTAAQKDSGNATADSRGATAGASAPVTEASNSVPQASSSDKQTADGAGARQAQVNASTQQAASNAGARTGEGQTRAATESAARNTASSSAAADVEASKNAEVEGDAGTQGELRAALGEWLAATNSRDVGRQMTFYAPTVDAFYLSRNASRAAVRAEKARIFARADSVNVEAASPEIRLSRDGRAAVMRFRKRYQITGGEGSRSGEVLQELRWRRTPSGWKIVGERDLRVIQ